MRQLPAGVFKQQTSKNMVHIESTYGNTRNYEFNCAATLKTCGAIHQRATHRWASPHRTPNGLTSPRLGKALVAAPPGGKTSS